MVKVELADGEVARRLPPFLPDTEPPQSVYNATVNRNQRSLCLDLHSPAGREVFLDLARRSDALIENFSAGTMDGWGLGYRDVRALKADVIYCSITGFGQWGPDHVQVAYDPLVQASSGFMSLNGDMDGAPVKAPTFLGDDISGLHSAIAVLGALWHRRRHRRGPAAGRGHARHIAVPVHRAADDRCGTALGEPVRDGRAGQRVRLPGRPDLLRGPAGQPVVLAGRRHRWRPRRRSGVHHDSRPAHPPRRVQLLRPRLGGEAHRGRGLPAAARGGRPGGPGAYLRPDGCRPTRAGPRDGVGAGQVSRSSRLRRAAPA